MHKGRLLLGVVGMSALAACAQPGANLQANVYNAGQVNKAQKASVVKILAVLPAKVQVSNAQARRNAQVVGAVLGLAAGAALGAHAGNAALGGGLAGAAAGAGAGSMIPGKTLVRGVSLTYLFHHQTLNSAQVGKKCQFKPGRAIMVSTAPGSTRIQPNAQCPVKKS